MKRVIVLFAIVLLLVPFTSLAQDFCEGNFDCDQDVDGSDASLFKSNFGRNSLDDPCSILDDCPNPWAPCPSGMLVCNNKCVDPQTDESYCGSCSNSCANGEVCFGGTCYTGGVQVYQAVVPKTGQTTSYATGDDGDLEKGIPWPNPRFTNNGDGTVTDNLTGLIWLRNANCFGLRTWNNAVSAANGLASGSCGLTDGSSAGDWRLPNRNELASLVHNGYYSPAVPNTAGTGKWSEEDPFTSVQTASRYWSSTTTAGYPGFAWIVIMYVGEVWKIDKTINWYVWPVRGVLPFTALAQDFCEGNFDCDQDVDGSDASLFKSNFGRNALDDSCSILDDCPNPWSPCPSGMLVCNNKCVDPQTDESYCGSCINSCANGEVCFGGTCYTGGVQVYQAVVPKTGQTTSYATGDDGDLEKGIPWPNPRFTDNGDGTVTDNLTGLIWLKDANCMKTHYPLFDGDFLPETGAVTWQHALDFVAGINSGTYSDCGAGATDWRLPNRNELVSLVHNGYYSPAVPNTAGTGKWSEEDPFNNLIPSPSQYWSSTTTAGYPANAWIVDMFGGGVYDDSKTQVASYVWPVRGGQ